MKEKLKDLRYLHQFHKKMGFDYLQEAIKLNKQINQMER